jgi:RND family efflux transporter MFP subunit
MSIDKKIRGKRMKKFLIFTILLFLGLVLGSGCSKSDGSDSEAEERIPVDVTTVKLGDVVQSLSYNGDIRAEYEVKVFSKIPDRIEKFYVDEGDFVKRGAPLAKILAITIEQGVRQAEAILLAAQAQEANLRVEYERAQRLSKENAMSRQQYDAVKTQYESVQAQVEQVEAALTSAKSQLNDALVSAPISGIIGKRYYDVGDMANPSQPLVTIVQMDRVKIEFDATEVDLGKLSIGQEAKIKVKAYPDLIFTGKVDKISPVLDPSTRMAQVEVLVDNPDGKLKPGMYSQVEVTTGIIQNVIVVPRYAAIENTTMESINGEDQVVKNYYVFIVDSSKAIQKKLDVSYVNHKSLAVDSGIQVGDQLVIEGQNNLRDSMLVTIVKEEEVSL